MMLERLSDEDARILSLERGPVAGHTLKVVLLGPAPHGGGPDIGALRDGVAARLERAPRLRQRLAPTPLGLAPPLWVDDQGFDVARHVRRLAGRGERLEELVAGIMRGRLPRDRPLWSLDLLDGLAGGGAALVWKLHHCMADGQTAMRLTQEVLWDADPPAAEPPAPSWHPRPAPGRLELAARGAGERAGSTVRGVAGLLAAPPSPARLAASAASARHLPGVLRRELLAPAGRSPLDRALTDGRAVAFASAALDDVRAIEHSFPERVTVNDVVLAAVAGALRGWLEHRHGAVIDLRVKVPVSLHRAGAEADTEANRDSFLFATLPLAQDDPRARLSLIAADTAQRKREHDPQALDALLGGLRRASPRLERFAERLAASPRLFALNVSNVRGPEQPRSVLGARVRALYSLAEIAPHHALRVAVISFAGTLHFGLCADPTVVDDLDVLAAGISRELEVLVRSS